MARRRGRCRGAWSTVGVGRGLSVRWRANASLLPNDFRCRFPASFSGQDTTAKFEPCPYAGPLMGCESCPRATFGEPRHRRPAVGAKFAPTASRPDPRHAVLRIVNQIAKEQGHRGERCLTLLHAAKNETFTPGRWQSLSDAPDEPGAALAATKRKELTPPPSKTLLNHG
jgi:hypothetical protein